MKNKWNSMLSNLVIAVSDILIIFIIFVNVGLAFQNDVTGFFGRGSLKVASVFIAVNMLTASLLNMYKFSFMKKSEIVMSEIIAGIVGGFAAVVYAVIDREYNFVLPVMQYTIIVSIFLSVAALCVWRVILDSALSSVHKKSHLIIIEKKNENRSAAVISEKINRTTRRFFEPDIVSIETESDAEIKEIENKIRECDSVLFTQSVPERIKKRLLSEAIENNKIVYVEPGLYEINLTKYALIQFDDTPVFLVKPFEIDKYQRVLKRAMDILLSLIGIIIASPFMLAAAAVIKLDSKGPVIYRQERVTIHKRKFYIYKFRTMVVDAEQTSGPQLAKKNDERITRVGRFLRAWRIDELPQMFNILKGDMSIVGPRPERPVFVEEFCEKYKGYEKRFIVKAGLTGYAQTYGKYDTDVRDKLLYDLLYIREYSIGLDIKIIFLTMKTVLTHSG